MIKGYTRILVCCPGSVITGGPELLHQLVHELRTLGHDAYITYYPFNQQWNQPIEYTVYDAPQIPFSDIHGQLIVIPETATWISRRVNYADLAIWWLSVDNYYERSKESKIIDIYRHVKGYIKPRDLSARKAPIWRLRKHIHFYQSEYANRFLQSKNIKGLPLTDYIRTSQSPCAERGYNDPKDNIICYNPKKGIKKTSRLIRAYPHFRFIPIVGLSTEQVQMLLCKAKIYIDFGHHPGKDRLPREAAIAGCCVITGRQGSAGNDIDVSLPQRYKLDDSSTSSYIAMFGNLASSIFDNYVEHSSELKHYRRYIEKEYSLFRKQVVEIFGQCHELVRHDIG